MPKKKIANHADAAVRARLFFELDWPFGAQPHTPLGTAYAPSESLGYLDLEIKALRELARKYDFDLPYAAPSGKSVVLPTIPKEWVSDQSVLGNFGAETKRFDLMILSLSNPSKNVPVTNKVLNALAISSLTLSVPLTGGGMSAIDAPKLQTLTNPEVDPKIIEPITICGVVKSISNHLCTIIVADKYFVRGVPAAGYQVGHHVTMKVLPTRETLRLDVVDWLPP